MMGLAGLRQANVQAEKAINWARTHGEDEDGKPYYFIDLVLLNPQSEGPIDHFINISGIDDLLPNKPAANENGKMEYTFNKEKGGYTKFTLRDDGSYVFTMWDTDHNRNFLATHWESGLWEIADNVIEKQIYALYEKIKESLKKEKETPVRKKMNELQREYKMARLDDKPLIMEQMQDIMSENAEKIMPPPKKTTKKPAKRQKYRPIPELPKPDEPKTPEKGSKEPSGETKNPSNKLVSVNEQ